MAVAVGMETPMATRTYSKTTQGIASPQKAGSAVRDLRRRTARAAAVREQTLIKVTECAKSAESL